MPNRDVQKLAEMRELADALDLFVYRGGRHTEEQRTRPDVLPAVRVPLEAGHHLEQRTDVALGVHDAALRRIDAGNHLQKRRLAGAVVADQADALALFNAKRDRLQRLDPPRRT